MCITKIKSIFRRTGTKTNVQETKPVAEPAEKKATNMTKWTYHVQENTLKELLDPNLAGGLNELGEKGLELTCLLREITTAGENKPAILAIFKH